VGQQQRALVRTELQIESLSFAQLSQLLSNLLKVLKIDGAKVGDLVKDAPTTASVAATGRAGEPVDTTGPEDEEENEGELADADAEAEVDEYGDLQEPVVDLDDTSAAAANPAEQSESASCDVVTHSGDFSLVALCETVTSAEAALELVTSLVIKKSAYAEVALLLAHFHAHGTFQTSDLVVGDHLQSADSATCPASFEAAPLCAVRESLPAAVAALDEQFGLRSARADLQALRTRSSELKTRTAEVERKLVAAKGASEELLRHADHLEYLAMKDQCFEKEDGAFTYSLCILGAITQKEVVGHRSVTLGTHEAVEVMGDSATPVHGVMPSALLKYGNGQHCHAFGARTATVTVSCAAKNALISATEPSTCAYRLHFESPAACTPKYAQMVGISA
jgi:hypothetical protein